MLTFICLILVKEVNYDIPAVLACEIHHYFIISLFLASKFETRSFKRSAAEFLEPGEEQGQERDEEC
jgi:hypothetical protein